MGWIFRSVNSDVVGVLCGVYKINKYMQLIMTFSSIRITDPCNLSKHRIIHLGWDGAKAPVYLKLDNNQIWVLTTTLEWTEFSACRSIYSDNAHTKLILLYQTPTEIRLRVQHGADSVELTYRLASSEDVGMLSPSFHVDVLGGDDGLCGCVVG